MIDKKFGHLLFSSRTICLCLVMILLNGCGFGGCFRASDIDNDHIQFVMPTAGPNDIKPGTPPTYWAKTGVSFYKSRGVSTVVKVSAYGVNLCSGIEKIIEILPGRSTSKLGFNVNTGDKLKVSLAPIEGHISSDACENLDPLVYFEDKDECKASIGYGYTSNINNSLDAASNRFYLRRPNFVTNPYHWLNGRLYSQLNEEAVLPKNGGTIDDACTTVNTSSPLGKVFKSTLPTAACVKQAQYLTPQTCSDTIKDLAISDRDIGRNDTLKINSICGNICGVELNCIAGGGANCIKVKNNHCAYSEVLRTLSGPVSNNPEPLWQDFENSQVKFLPFLAIRLQPNGAVFPSYNDSFLGVSGLATDKPFDYTGQDICDTVELSLGESAPTPVSSQVGGYRISITKDCTEATQNSLYYMISDSLPTIMPGEAGTTKIDFVNNQQISIPSNVEGDLYVAVLDPDNNYNNNEGYFKIEAITPKPQSNYISTIVEYVKKYIMIALYGPDYNNFFKIGSYGSGAVGSIYNTLTRESFLGTVRTLLTLYIVLHSSFFLIGLKKSSVLDLTIWIAKIALVMQLLLPGSWEFFNKHLFLLFSQAPSYIAEAISNRDISVENGFEFLDRPFYRFMYPQTWLQILSLLFAGVFGWVSIIIILWAIWAIISAIFELVVTYFISLIMVGILLSLAPFFLCMILFQRTKGIFDMWIAALSQNAMHPVVMFTSFAFMGEIVSNIAYSLFSFDVCSDCIAQANIELGDVKFPICLLDFLLPTGFSSSYSVEDYTQLSDDPEYFMGIPVSIAKLIMLVVSANAMKHTIEFAGNVVLSIFGIVASDLSSVGHQATQEVLGLVGMDKDSRDRKVISDHNTKQNAGKGDVGERTSRKDAGGKEPTSSGGKKSRKDEGSK